MENCFRFYELRPETRYQARSFQLLFSYFLFIFVVKTVFIRKPCRNFLHAFHCKI